MMDLVIIGIVSAAASLITLFSGFGLGTILTPAFLFFFPVDTAIALTGVVHLLTNLFKVVLLGQHARWDVVIRFGLPSVIGAFIGAELLLQTAALPPIATYVLGGSLYTIGPMKLLIAAVMMFFAFVEFLPAFHSFAPSDRWLTAGGVLSGFFGGLSGHQGALRSAFLVRYGLPKEAFLATGIIIACGVDLTRLSLYASRLLDSGLVYQWPTVAVAVVSAFAGAYIGNRLIHKVTVQFVQRAVAVMLMLIAAGLGSGLL